MSRESAGTANDVLKGGGDAGALARATDWSKTPIGPVEGWSQALRSAAALVLNNHSEMLLWWGPEFVQIYNDAYRPVLGDKHPRAMGQRFRDCWAEVFHILGPWAERPFRGGPASTSEDIAVPINRKVHREEAHFRLAYSPVPDDTVPTTGVGGVLAVVSEITQLAYADRQLRTLRELGARSAEASTAEQACQTAAETLRENPWDIPFALFYLLDDGGRDARLVAKVGFEHAPAWRYDPVARERRIETLDDLSFLGEDVPLSPWSDRPREAIVLPLASPDQATAYGVLVCGVSPHRVLDAGYRTFFELAAAQIISSIRNARALEEQRKRAEALAELDRAKTAFFSNVSHEFRTPLTLMLGPTEDSLRDRTDPLPPAQRERLETIHRNGQRLLRLVNTLLDFSRIEAGRIQASYQPTELCALTAELASAFRSLVENAGVTLDVDCGPLAEPVYVDRDMYEKIVLNLLSNAFKFTLHGAIRVALEGHPGRAELSVTDTGTGIPEHELPHVFERFHRVEGARGRSFEGSGIGLALVQELVRLHGGTIAVESKVDVGTRFTVSFPTGTAHLPPERIARDVTPMRAGPGAARFVDEASQWTQAPSPTPSDLDLTATTRTTARILLADDNADMRAYVERLLAAQGWEVEAVASGDKALERAVARPPSLVISDVMMPGLDGFELLAALKSDARTRAVPVVLLSARAGEDARIGGLAAGADDYLVKPFSARELVARVQSQLSLAGLRRTIVAELELADRRKDEFLAMLAHELRNPMAAIAMALSMLELGNDPAKAERHRETAKRQLNHLVRLVDDLLDVSRITQGKVELRKENGVDLVALVQNALTATRPAIEARGHALSVSLAPGGFRMDADATRLEQVVVNLLTNAAKYTDPGGAIAVTLTREVVELRPVAVLRIRDNGRGIPPDMLEHVFELFVQVTPGLDRATGGLGLGLTLVKRLVEMHGGSVTALSDGAGRGTEMVVRLPLLAVRELRHGSAHDKDAVEVVQRTRRILIVEDSEDVRDTLKDLLEHYGHEVFTANDGVQGLDRLRELWPDIALVDVGLPGIDGYELARRVRREPVGPRPFLVALTGYGGHDAKVTATTAGFDVHLIKPIDIAQLHAIIDSSRLRF